MNRRPSKRKPRKNVTFKAKSFKRRFDSLLRHIKLILMQYREILSPDEWQVLVDQTRIAIAKYPDQFLGGNLPPKDVAREAINLVFEGFLRDMHIRKVQSFRKQNTFGSGDKTW